MPQQINLLTPILLAPRRYFSALTLLQATLLLLVGGVATALWLQQRDRAADVQHQALLARYATERQQLLVARANLPAPQDASALQTQLQALETGNGDRAVLLRALGSDGGARAGRQHSDLLALVARTLPDSAWLSDMRYTPGRLELSGGTLNTAPLRSWLGQLADHPLLAGQQLSALRVERVGAAGGESQGRPLLEGADRLASARVPVWGFRVVSTPALAASAISGAPR
ncbi:MAG TPA: PilN domain-containing protein [Roseateles sp.]